MPDTRQDGEIMGCDIHVYIEKKKNGKWIPAQGFMQTDEDSLPDVPHHDKFSQRKYCLFGYIAGVRCPGLQHFKTNGFPMDASRPVKMQYKRMGVDAHTPSYLTLFELQTVDWHTDKIDCGYGQGPVILREAFQAFYDLVFWLQSYDYTCRTDEIRIVFWFDN
jgi:hypothetical protein